MNGNDIKQLRKELDATKAELKKVSDIMFGIADNIVFKAKVRKQVVEKNAAGTLPVITDTNGNRWQINSVTKLN